MAAGNWTPELIDLAGGEDVFGRPGSALAVDHVGRSRWRGIPTLSSSPPADSIWPATLRGNALRMADRPEFARLKAVPAWAAFFWPMATNTSTGQARAWQKRLSSSIKWFTARWSTKVTVAAPMRGSYTQDKSTRPMASKIIKGLAVAAGLGLAIGIGSGNRRAEENHMGTKLPDDGPEPGLVAERLDRIEVRMSAIESRSQISAGSEAGPEIEALQAQVTEHRKKVAGQVAAIEKRFEMLAREIPAVLDSIVGPRVDEMRTRLRTEIQQSVAATLAKFERAINTRLAERIATVEKAIREQSVTVNALSRRAVESDANMQRLVAAVERLCEDGILDPSALREPFVRGATRGERSGAPPGREAKARCPGTAD